jgi:hypothetical protein
MQTALLASMPEVKQIHNFGGIILNAAAVDAKRNLVMKIEEPFAGLANLLIPLCQLVPSLPQAKFHRDPAQACFLLAPGYQALTTLQLTVPRFHAYPMYLLTCASTPLQQLTECLTILDCRFGSSAEICCKESSTEMKNAVVMCMEASFLM